jgi:DNA-binding IclR family transcriptional regulator
VLPRGQWPDEISDQLRDEVADAAARGFATSHDEVIPSLRSVSVPLVVRGRRPSAIAVVYVASAHEHEQIAARLQRSAAVIRDALGG